jgi:hypothetical protein
MVRKTRKQRGGNRQTIDKYKYLLSTFAYSDAQHDFKNVKSNRTSYYNLYKNTIARSISESPYNELNENQLLELIKITHITNKPNRKQFTLNNIIEEYVNNDGSMFVEMLIDNILKRSYTIHVVHYQTNNDIIVNPQNFIHYFASMRTFIIDQFTMKFLMDSRTIMTLVYIMKMTHFIYYIIVK